MTESSVGLRELIYCTIVARNYLPQAHSLLASIRAQQPDVPLRILVVDGVPAGVGSVSGVVEYDDLSALELSEREIVNLTAIYDVVELSTAVKARYLQVLLGDSRRVVYLDPDMYLVTPLAELPDAIDKHGVVLTPHLLFPIEPGTSFISEGSSLTVGIHNLGFCAVGQDARPFLSWWWSHLERECLIYPLLGLFVDQKWTDMGAVLFNAHTLRHSGYNVGHWNLHERRFERRGGEYVMAADESALRLMHFSGFNPRDPEAISVRQNESLKGKGLGFDALMEISHEYAAVMLEAETRLGSQPPYGFSHDSSGKRMTYRLRRTYRSAVLADGGGPLPPSPFNDAEATEWAHWRRRSLVLQGKNLAPDAALAFKYAFPDAFKAIKTRLPSLSGRLRRTMLDGAKVRR